MPAALPMPLAVALRLAGPSVAEALAVAGQVADALAAAPRHSGRIIVPSFGDIRLQADGDVTWAYGRETRPEDAARAIARLLLRLLRTAEQAGGRVPAPLKYAVGRALDDRAPAPLGSLDELRRVLDRFGPGDRRDAIAMLVRRAGAVLPQSTPFDARSTIADVRRARRDTGLTLGSISGSTGIPISLLRELEWGLFDNWGRGAQTDEAVRSYAAAAGLEADGVLAIVRPHLNATSSATTALTRGRSRPLGIMSTTIPAPTRSARAHRVRTWRYLTGVAALLLVAATVAWLLWAARAASSGPAGSHAVVLPPARPEAARPKPAPLAVTPVPAQPTPRVATPRHAARTARPSEIRTARRTFWNRPLLILKVGKRDAENRNQNRELKSKN